MPDVWREVNMTPKATNVARVNSIESAKGTRIERLRWGWEANAGVMTSAEALQSRYLRDVYRYVARRVDRREDAEDITAEVFAAAFQSLKKYRGDCDPKLWLLGIARRKVADSLRRTSRNAEAFISDLSP